MDWTNERYVRLYTRTTADLLAIGWEGRFVWYELLRHADRAGVIDTGGDIAVIPELLRVPIEIFETGFPRIVDRGGMIEVHAASLIVTNYEDANEARQSDAQRSREARARRRDRARAAKLQNVTKRDAIESQNVSPATRSSHDASHDVTPCRAVPSLAVPVQSPSGSVDPTSSGPPAPKKDKVKRWEGQEIRESVELATGAAKKFGRTAGDVIELCARIAEGRKTGKVAATTLTSFTNELAKGAAESMEAFEYGVRQVLDLDDGFEYSGRPSRIANYIKTCMNSWRPNGTNGRTKMRTQSGERTFGSSDIQKLAKRAREVDGQ